MKSTNKKRILLFLETYNNGGIEKVVDTYNDYLKNNYKVSILCSENKSNKNINHLLKHTYNHYIRTYLSFIKFKNHLKHNHYDIIHIHVYNGIGLKYAYIASKYTPNVIVQAHNNGFDKDIFKIKSLINKHYIKKYMGKYKLLSVSTSSSIFCFNKKSQIIPNSFNYNDFIYNENIRNKLRKTYQINNNSLVIGNIGRLNKQKNQEFLIKVFNEYYKTNNNSYLILIGNGPLKYKIKKLSSGHVIIIDNIKDINEYYNMFDIYMHPSLFEGFGRTIVEAQINGLYTIISNNISSETIISKNVIKLPLDKQLWLDNIYKLKRNNKVSNLYQNDRVLELLKSIYKEY